MFKKKILVFVLSMFMTVPALATSIRAFSYSVASSSDAAGFAESKVTAMTNVYIGDVVYVAVRKTVFGEDEFFRLDYASGAWHAGSIEPHEYTYGRIQERLMQELINSQRQTLFTTVHGGGQGFNIDYVTGGGTTVRVTPWVCTQCKVTITDLPSDEVHKEDE